MQHSSRQPRALAELLPSGHGANADAHNRDPGGLQPRKLIHQPLRLLPRVKVRKVGHQAHHCAAGGWDETLGVHLLPVLCTEHPDAPEFSSKARLAALAGAHSRRWLRWGWGGLSLGQGHHGPIGGCHVDALQRGPRQAGARPRPVVLLPDRQPNCGCERQAEQRHDRPCGGEHPRASLSVCLPGAQCCGSGWGGSTWRDSGHVPGRRAAGSEKGSGWCGGCGCLHMHRGLHQGIHLRGVEGGGARGCIQEGPQPHTDRGHQGYSRDRRARGGHGMAPSVHKEG
mmetsp:Transcript_64272/g.106308  ORF Transcript_64272/g.106308 Transcript_64272/m.106308 type:complete len:284 (-) Transcript_64272:57-908(-)